MLKIVLFNSVLPDLVQHVENQMSCIVMKCRHVINYLLTSLGGEDCETLMVDPDANVYVITKVHGGHGSIAQVR